MRSLIHEIATQHPPEALTEQLRGEPGLVLLSSGACDWPQTRYSFVAARPFLTFRSFGSRCELQSGSAIGDNPVQFGNPWHLLESLMSRYELLDEVDLPFPLGGCFGYWGYGLKNFVEPRLPRRAANDLELPDCHVGFYDSLVVFDHWLGKTWIISTGLEVDGSRNEEKRQRQLKFWRGQLQKLTGTDAVSGTKESCGPTRPSCGYLALNSDFSLGAKEKITPPIGSPGRDSLRCARAVGRPAHEAPPTLPRRGANIRARRDNSPPGWGWGWVHGRNAPTKSGGFSPCGRRPRWGANRRLFGSGCIQLLPPRFPGRRGTGARLHSRRRYLSGQPGATTGGGLSRQRLGILFAPVRRFPRAICGFS